MHSCLVQALYLSTGYSDFLEEMLSKIKEGLSKIKKKKHEYAIYVVFAVFLLIPICVLITSPDLALRLLAVSVAVAILGVIFSMWSFFRSSEKQDEIVELKRDELNKKDEEVGELKKANKLKEKELEKLESKITQTRDIEEQRRKDKERPATKSLKEEFEKFLSYWKENNELIFEKPDKKLIGGDILFKRKIPWMEIESIGKESTNVIEDNKNILGANTENEAIKIADAVIELSKLIRQIENLRLSDEYYIEGKKRAFGEGDKIIKSIEAFIEKI